MTFEEYVQGVFERELGSKADEALTEYLDSTVCLGNAWQEDISGYNPVILEAFASNIVIFLTHYQKGA